MTATDQKMSAILGTASTMKRFTCLRVNPQKYNSLISETIYIKLIQGHWNDESKLEKGTEEEHYSLSLPFIL